MPRDTEDQGPVDEDHPATTVLGVAGSLRAGSFNRLLLAQAATVAPTDTRIAVWDDLGSVPPFNEDDEASPAPSVVALRGAIAASDAVLIVTPEYNGSIPGQLKNALDWASRPFRENVLRDKPVAVVGASPSPGGARRAQEETRFVLGRIGAHVLEDGVAVARAHDQFDDAGNLVDEALRTALASVMERLTDAVHEQAEAAA